MKARNPKLTTLTMGAVFMSLAACGPGEEKSGDGAVEVDHVTAQQAITGNTTDIATKLSTTISFLDNSNLFNTGIDAAFASGEEPNCVTTGPDGETFEGPCETTETETEVAVDTNFDEEAAELAEVLESRIFHEDNVEDEDGLSVTYLLRGEVVCAEDGAPADPECVSSVDEAQIRLVVTSPDADDVDVDLLIGPDRANPFSFQVHDDLLAAEVDFGGIKASADHIGGIIGEEAELPATMEGRIRAQLKIEGEQKVSAALSVLNAIKVADGDYTVAIAKSEPAIAVTVDGVAKTLETVTNLGAVDASLPITNEEFDDTTGDFVENTYQAGLHLGGLTGTTVFDGASDVFSVLGLGLGSTATTLSVDGNEVLAIDLNKDSGRTLDVTATAGADDSVELAISPNLDLSVALKFAAAAGAMGEVDEWMLDDVLHILLDGADEPKLRFSESGTEIVEGSLTMSLANAGTTVTAEAGMCLLPVDEAPVVVGTEEPGTEPLPEESTNPLEEIEVGACQ